MLKTTTKIDPRLLGAKCRWCPFSKAGAPVKPLYGEGPAKSQGLVFAESPGHEEVSRGRLLVGATGQEFDKTLLSHGLQRSKLFIVNVIACAPVGPKSEANMQKATECCRPFVLAQIRKYGKEPHVLALGKWAWFSLVGVKIALRNGRGFLRKWTLEMMINANTDALNRMRKEMDKRGNLSREVPKGGSDKQEAKP